MKPSNIEVEGLKLVRNQWNGSLTMQNGWHYATFNYNTLHALFLSCQMLHNKRPL